VKFQRLLYAVEYDLQLSQQRVHPRVIASTLCSQDPTCQADQKSTADKMQSCAPDLVGVSGWVARQQVESLAIPEPLERFRIQFLADLLQSRDDRLELLLLVHFNAYHAD
jgi:hypothetical protein